MSNIPPILALRVRLDPTGHKPWSLNLRHVKGAWLLIAQSENFFSIHDCRFQLRCSVFGSKGFPAVHEVYPWH